MIKDIGSEILIQNILRPSRMVLERFKKHDVAKISDSMGRYGTLKNIIKPIDDNMRLCGPAITVTNTIGCTKGAELAAKIAHKGDIIVIDAQEIDDLFVANGFVYKLLAEKGVSGLVVDGAVCDIKDAKALNFPVFAMGITQKCFKKQTNPIINVPICCAGMVVYPGDLIIGDSDGVVVVPGQDLERVLDLADKKLAKELYNKEQLESGIPATKYYGFDKKLEKWRDL